MSNLPRFEIPLVNPNAFAIFLLLLQSTPALESSSRHGTQMLVRGMMLSPINLALH
jgi:hypothetical protein